MFIMEYIEGNRYIVTVNKPYYPEVEFFDTIEEAQKQRDEWIEAYNELDGKYQTDITIAMIIENKKIRTAY